MPAVQFGTDPSTAITDQHFFQALNFLRSENLSLPHMLGTAVWEWFNNDIL